MSSPNVDQTHGADDGRQDGAVMGLLEHLDELRTRLIRACLAVVAGMAVSALYAEALTDVVLKTMYRALPPGIGLVTTKPGEGFAFYFDLTLMGGVALATPVVAFQVWRFVAPGLYSREKRLALPFLAVAVMATAAGLAFAHFMLFPATMEFLIRFRWDKVTPTWRLEETFALYTNSMLAMATVFQLPTLVFFLARVRLVSASFLWRHLKHAVLLSFIASAFLTASADPANQALTAAPILALYLTSILIAWLVRPRSVHTGDEPVLRLVFIATLLEQAWRTRRRSAAAPSQRLVLR